MVTPYPGSQPSAAWAAWKSAGSWGPRFACCKLRSARMPTYRDQSVANELCNAIWGMPRRAPRMNHEEGSMRGSMRVLAQGLLLTFVIGLPTGQALSQSTPARVVTAAEYERWKTELSNWGR